jgi:hypothetical protein
MSRTFAVLIYARGYKMRLSRSWGLSRKHSTFKANNDKGYNNGCSFSWEDNWSWSALFQ